jgi:hypothetical protein
MTRALTKALAPIALLLNLTATVAAEPMVFAEQFNGAMRIDGNSTWISAEGEITPDTPATFEKFLTTATIFKNQRIALNSPGGSVLAGMKLGAIIRQRGFLTAVARSSKDGSFSSLAPGVCASSCVFALAGGTERSVVAPSRVGVHQISIDFQSMYKTSAVSVEDLDQSFAISQTAIGLAISYFLEMAIDPSIVTMMTTKAPTEIKWLSDAELTSTKIKYDPKVFSNWAVEPYRSGLVAFTKSLDGARQLTLFCAANKMKFRLTANGGAYAMNFVSSAGNVKDIEVAGMVVSKPNFKMSDVKEGMLIIGDWIGTEVTPKPRSTFSLHGSASGSIADLYSMYEFNELGFQQSLQLARKNCVSY